MIAVFDDALFVHYGFVHLSAEDEADVPADLGLFFGGQQNGICGAAVPHLLTMMTGTHTGEVRFRIEWHDTAPALDPGWEDVVEVSLDVVAATGQLSTFDDYRDISFPASGPHRARFHAIGMDAADEVGEDEPADDDPPAPDHYLLQLWPAPMAADALLEVATGKAQYWHDEFGGSPALTPSQLAAARAADDASHSTSVEDFDQDHAMADDAAQLRVISHLLALDADAQRTTARRLARQTVDAAAMGSHPAFVAALQALDAGRPLPAPFQDFAAAASLALDAAGEPPVASEAVNDPDPDDGFGWYLSMSVDIGTDEGRSNRALHAVAALDAAAGADAARAVVLAYRSAAAADESDGELTFDLLERLVHRST